MFTVFVIFVNFDRQYVINVTFDSDEIYRASTSYDAVSSGEEVTKSITILLRKTGPKYTEKRFSTHFRRELRKHLDS